MEALSDGLIKRLSAAIDRERKEERKAKEEREKRKMKRKNKKWNNHKEKCNGK